MVVIWGQTDTVAAVMGAVGAIPAGAGLVASSLGPKGWSPRMSSAGRGIAGSHLLVLNE